MRRISLAVLTFCAFLGTAWSSPSSGVLEPRAVMTSTDVRPAAPQEQGGGETQFGDVPIEFDFDADSVAARVLPGETVHWLGFEVQHSGYNVTFWLMGGTLADDDRDGRVQYNIPDPPALRVNSMFFFVGSRGRIGVATPAAALVRQRSPTFGGPAGALDRLTVHGVVPGAWAVLLWVRPDVGAWYADVDDSGRYDADRAPNGEIITSPAAFRPWPGNPSTPSSYHVGDVVLVMYPHNDYSTPSRQLRTYSIGTVTAAIAGVSIPALSDAMLIGLLLCVAGVAVLRLRS